MVPRVFLIWKVRGVIKPIFRSFTEFIKLDVYYFFVLSRSLDCGVNSRADDALREESKSEKCLLRFYNFYSQLKWWKIGWKTSYKCILFLSVFTSSWIIDVLVPSHLNSKTVAPHHAATVDRLRPGARYLYLQSPAAGLCNWMQIFIWAPSAAMSPSSCIHIHLPVVLNFHSQQAVFWIKTATRRGFPVGNRSSASWFCLPMLSSFPNPNMYYNCDKFLWKESQRQATKRNVLCLWLSFRMLPTKTDRSPASSAHTPAPAALSNTAVWSQAAQSSGLHFTNS